MLQIGLYGIRHSSFDGGDAIVVRTGVQGEGIVEIRLDYACRLKHLAQEVAEGST